MSANEDLVHQQLEINRAKQEVARIETAGLLKWAAITRYAILPGILIPIVGFIWILCVSAVAFFVALAVVIRGNKEDGLKSVMYAVLTGVLSFLLWLPVGFLMIGTFQFL